MKMPVDPYSAVTQACEVFRIMLYSLGRWPFKVWLSFWTTNKKKMVVELNGIKITIRTGNIFAKCADISMSYECIARDDYGLRSLNVREGHILDIGAHIGSFSLAAAKKFPKAEILCFEPSPENYSALIENIRINRLNNITPFNKAVSSDEKEIPIFINPANSAANSIYGSKGIKVKVQSISLKKIFADNKIKKCAFAKIDCEGSEYDILFNAPSEILKKIGHMVIEYHEPSHFGITQPRYNPSNLARKLEDAGFECRLKKVKRYQGIIIARLRKP